MHNLTVLYSAQLCGFTLREQLMLYSFGVLDERPHRPKRVIIIKGRA